MTHTPYCVEPVIATLNLPPADSAVTLDTQGADTVKMEIPAGRALIVIGQDNAVELTMQGNGAKYEIPCGWGKPLRIVMEQSGGGLAQVKATGSRKVTVWADIDAPQVDCSFERE